jgi:hypothetical protein
VRCIKNFSYFALFSTSLLILKTIFKVLKSLHGISQWTSYRIRQVEIPSGSPFGKETHGK